MTFTPSFESNSHTCRVVHFAFVCVCMCVCIIEKITKINTHMFRVATIYFVFVCVFFEWRFIKSLLSILMVCLCFYLDVLPTKRLSHTQTQTYVWCQTLLCMVVRVRMGVSCCFVWRNLCVFLFITSEDFLWDILKPSLRFLSLLRAALRQTLVKI